MDIGFAISQLQAGQRVSRDAYNPTGDPDGVWLVLVPGSRITVETGRPLGEAAPELVGQQLDYLPHIDIRTLSGALSPWQPEQHALLADDWYVIQDQGAQQSGLVHYMITPRQARDPEQP